MANYLVSKQKKLVRNDRRIRILLTYIFPNFIDDICVPREPIHLPNESSKSIHEWFLSFRVYLTWNRYPPPPQIISLLFFSYLFSILFFIIQPNSLSNLFSPNYPPLFIYIDIFVYQVTSIKWLFKIGRLSHFIIKWITQLEQTSIDAREVFYSSCPLESPSSQYIIC